MHAEYAKVLEVATEGSLHQCNSIEGVDNMPKAQTTATKVPTQRKPLDPALVSQVEVLDDAEMPTAHRSGVTSKLAEVLAKSREAGNKVVVLTVPTENVKSIKSALHQAAARINSGIRIREVAQNDGTTKVHFQAKERTLKPRGAKK